jgi:hypothetical protein
MTKYKKNQIPANQDGIWQLVRTFKIFTLGDIARHIEMDRGHIAVYLKVLKKAGFIKANDNPVRGKPITYTLIKDNGIHRPQLDLNGSEKPISLSQKIWVAIKALKVFDHRDVSLLVDCKENYIKSYLKQLRMAGYLRVKEEATRNTTKKYIFLTTKDTGRNAPQIKKDKSVYDQNIRKIVWSPTPKKQEGL